MQDLGAQGLGDLVDVVQQLGSSTLGVVVQALQAGVEGAQLLVGREGSVAGCGQLAVGFPAGRCQRRCEHGGDAGRGPRGCLPQGIDVLQQVDVGAGHVEALQRVQDELEAGHGVVGGGLVGGLHGQQAAVDVGLVGVELAGALLQVAVMLQRGVLRVVEVALGVVQLLLEQAVLLVDAGQQLVQRVEVLRGLQLVVEVVGHAGLLVVVVHGWRSRAVDGLSSRGRLQGLRLEA